jgi:hypothetical protein
LYFPFVILSSKLKTGMNSSSKVLRPLIRSTHLVRRTSGSLVFFSRFQNYCEQSPQKAYYELEKY